MPLINAKIPPVAEAITWDGKNSADILDLAIRARTAIRRVHDGMNFKVVEVEPELGLHIYRTVDDKQLTYYRIELDNTLVFDPFTPTDVPIFVMTPEEFATFYTEEV